MGATARIALVAAYDGASYHGFQYQNPAVPTVQGSLEAALGRVADHDVALVCAGRTDTGVHATHQVVHFDTSAQRPDKAWVLGSNKWLPDTIGIAWAGRVDDAFSARHSATARRYVYLIYNSRLRSPLLHRQLTRESRPLNEELMARAGASLLGEHDFNAYRSSECQSPSPVRTVHRLEVYRRGDLVIIDITANAFLHHMVRNVAGVLMAIGAGDAAPAWAAHVLASRDRRAGGVTAPPHGLYLVDVRYPAHFGIPCGPDLPHLYSAVAN